MKEKSYVILNKPEKLKGLSEIGISDTAILPYKKKQWINTTSNGFNYHYLGFGICGTISTVMALVYLDRYKDDDIIVPLKDVYDENVVSEIIEKLKWVIEPPLPGAFAKDIIRGVKLFYKSKYSNIEKGKYLPFKCKKIEDINRQLDKKLPVMAYINKLNGKNPYGLHWVLLYKYIISEDGIWYKCADNWGNIAYIEDKLVKYGVSFRED